MTNTIKNSKIDVANNLTIDHANKTIKVSKQFSKAAGKYGTKEYELFTELMAKHTGYSLMVNPTKKRSTLRITYDFMTKYISKHDESGEEMNTLLVKRGLKADENGEISAESFIDIKKWFVEKYPEVKGKAA